MLLVGACTSDAPLPTSHLDDVDPSTAEEGNATRAAQITVDVATVGRTFDRRLLGTNLPAWIGPEQLADPTFRTMALRSGASLIRMPGGSWSNAYDWSACELRDVAGCFFPDAARPTDFVDFLQATHLPGSWTVSINESAQSAAAAVAFFNGSVDDDRKIGRDRNGIEWGTVGFWAGVRAGGGNPDPIGIMLWEVGNEVYGGKPESGGDQCASFGWEDVWTCDGTEYTLGDAEHDGYLAIRAAMQAVDPTISVGAVGVGKPGDWSGWGNEVIAAAGDDLDFYVVHAYGFDKSPTGQQAVNRAGQLWSSMVDDVRSTLDDAIPLAVTEYNLVSFESGDTNHTMTQAMNALFLADTIGQLATHGVSIASQWNLANGTTAGGTDYGLIKLDDGSPYPGYEALRMWAGAGTELLAVAVDGEALHAYATRHGDGHVTVLVVNLDGDVVQAAVELDDGPTEGSAEVTGVYTDDLAAPQLEHSDETIAAMVDGALEVTLPGWSIISIEVTFGE